MRPTITRGPDLTPERTASGATIRTLLDTTVLDTTVLDTTGLDTTGLDTTVLDTTGLDTTGLDAGGAGGRLVRRLVDVPAGASYAGMTGPAAELWFLISGRGRLAAGGRAAVVARYQGVWWPPGVSGRLHADEPVQLDAVTLPAGAAAGAGAAGAGGGPLVSRLDDRAVETTGDRRFRVLFGPGAGCAQATQFVGEIPPGRAPPHRHPYDEVVLVLAGQGIVHTDDADHPLAPGTCVHLPPGQPHCLENTGPATLVVLGVFHPGGSPAAKSGAAGQRPD